MNDRFSTVVIVITFSKLYYRRYFRVIIILAITIASTVIAILGIATRILPGMCRVEVVRSRVV